MRELVRSVKESWLSLGVKLVPGASTEDIQRFQARYGVSLSTEVRDFFSSVGGMEEGDVDGLLMAFLPLHSVRRVPEELSDYGGIPDYRRIGESLPDAASCYVFIDYMMRSHVYALRLAPDPMELSPVIWISGAENAVMANSLTEFLEAYLADPYSILFPEEP
jgi:cell wall assembly regulator SMI1